MSGELAEARVLRHPICALDMLPAKVGNNSIYGTGADIELPSQRGLANAAEAILRADCKHSCFRQHSPKIARTLRNLPLTACVSHVLRMGAQKHMRRVDAARVIPAGAVMANFQPVGNRAAGQFPGDAVCSQTAILVAQCAISANNKGRSPQPTGIRTAGLINVFPEAISESAGVVAVLAEAATKTAVLCTGGASHKRYPTKGTLRRNQVRWFVRLARGWYTSHVNISLLGVGRSPAGATARGLFMPNYTLFRHNLQSAACHVHAREPVRRRPYQAPDCRRSAL